MKTSDSKTMEKFRAVEAQLKNSPLMDGFLDRFSAIDRLITVEQSDVSERGAFRLPYSSDAPMVGESWK